MIEQYLAALKQRIEGERINCIFRHSSSFDAVEVHLRDTERYVGSTPPGFPSHPNEREWYRWLRMPIEGRYQGYPVKLATTTLHLKPNHGEKNIDAVVLHHDAAAESLGLMSSVYLLEEGFIVAAYDIRDPPYSPTLCWGPEPAPASSMYPKSYLSIEMSLHGVLDRIPDMPNELKSDVAQSEPSKAAATFIMLCVEIAKRARQS